MKLTPILLAAVLVAGPASSLAKAAPTIAITTPWIAPPPNGAPTAAGYAVIRNESQTPDALLGVSTPAAERVEVHAMSSAGGVMRMRPVTDLTILPGQALTLSPSGGYHLMFVRPRKALKTGERVPATLTFAKAGAVKTTFVVQPAPDRMAMR